MRWSPPIALAIGIAWVGACSSDPPGATPSPADAGIEAEAGDADAGSSPTLPYPPGPYGIGVGDVMPNLNVQGYRLSPTQRDSRRLPFTDISLAEVRSNPVCSCVLIVWSTAGKNCGPCVEMDQTLATIIAKTPSICPLEILAANFDARAENPGGPLDQPATRADLDATTLAGRQPFPVGIPTGSIAAAGLRAVPFFPGIFVMNAQDMRLKDLLQGGGGTGGVEARIRKACENPGGPTVEPLTTASVAPRHLVVREGRVFLATEEPGILSFDTSVSGATLSPLVSDLTTKVANLTTDASFLYWTTTSAPYEIARVPFTGGARQTLTTHAAEYRSIAIDGAKVWFTRSDVVGSVPLGGGPETPLATGEESPTAIAVDDVNVYFIASGSIIKSPKAALARAVVATPVTFARPNEGITSATLIGLGLSDTSILVSGEFTFSGFSVAVFGKLPKTGGAPATFTGLRPRATTFGNGNIYAATPESQSPWSAIERVPIPFGDQTSMLTLGQYDVSTLAVDATHAYWTTRPLENGVQASATSLRRIRFR